MTHKNRCVKIDFVLCVKARVVKLVDTQVSEACGRKAVLVQVQSRALK